MPVVPDLTGKAPGEAFRKVREAGLRPVLLALPSIPIHDVAHRLVTQDPAPGADVPEGARVALAFGVHILTWGNLLPPEYAPPGTAVPKVVGLELEDAISALHEARFQPYVCQPSRAVESLVVTRQEPPAGEGSRSAQVALYLD